MSREKKESAWDELERMLESEAPNDNAIPIVEPEQTDGSEKVDASASEETPAPEIEPSADEDPNVEKKAKKLGAKPSKKASREKDADSKKAKAERGARKGVASRLAPEAKVALALDLEQSLEALDVSSLASDALAQESADAAPVKPAPKRRRRPRPATEEEEREEEKTFGDILSQVARVAQGKKITKKSSRSAKEKDVAATEEAPVENADRETESCEAFSINVESVEPDDAGLLDFSVNETPDSETADVDVSLPDGFWEIPSSDEEQKLLDGVLGFAAPAVDDSETQEEEQEQEEEEPVSEEKRFVDEFSDFWNTDDTIDLSWGANAKTEEPEAPAVKDEIPEETVAEESELENVAEEDSDVEVAAVEDEVPEAPGPVVPETVADVNFDDPDNLEAFFSYSTNDNLGFAPAKKTESKPAKKNPRRDEKPRDVAEAVFEEKPVDAETALYGERVERGRARRSRDERFRDAEPFEEYDGQFREVRAPRNNRRRSYDDETDDLREVRAPRNERRRGYEEEEESREVRAARNNRRRDYEDEEELREVRAPRNDRRRSFEDEEDSGEIRAARGNRRRGFEGEEDLREDRAPGGNRRRGYDDEEDACEVRAPRDGRRRRYEEEPDSYEVRASRGGRRRAAQDESEPREVRASASERRRIAEEAPSSGPAETVDRKPERILPSWDDAVGYVVNFNLGRRLNHGRNKRTS